MRDLASPGRRVPLPARRSAPVEAEPSPPQSGSFSAGRLRRPVPKPNHPPRSRGPSLPAACGGLCRPEVGVPLPARRSAPVEAAFPCLRVALPRAKPNHPPRNQAEPSPPQSGSFSAGRLRRPVPTGGRRSLACASLHADWGGAVSTASRRSMPVGDRRSIPAPAARRRRAREFRIRRAAPGGPAPGPHPNELTAAPPGSQAAAPVPDR